MITKGKLITRRGQRVRFLLKRGFILFEAKQFSKINMGYVPWFKQLVIDRKAEYEAYRMAGKEPLPEADFQKIWREYVLEAYDKHGWYKPVGLGRIILDPWKLVRKYENIYKAKFPEYESPWQKRGKSMPDFLAKLERTIAKQRGLDQSRETHRRTATA